jgi:hypothetical protein
MTWIFLFLVIVVAYLGFRLIRAIEALVKYVIQERPSISIHHAPHMATNSEDVRTKATRVVAELPPDIIAPNIRKPPKSRGGVGSDVRTNDNTQIQPDPNSPN